MCIGLIWIILNIAVTVWVELNYSILSTVGIRGVSLRYFTLSNGPPSLQEKKNNQPVSAYCSPTYSWRLGTARPWPHSPKTRRGRVRGSDWAINCRSGPAVKLIRALSLPRVIVGPAVEQRLDACHRDGNMRLHRTGACRVNYAKHPGSRVLG